jgi:hypothetical protein
MLGAQRRSQQRKDSAKKKIFCIQKKKRLFVQSYENAARIKEYNKKYF